MLLSQPLCIVLLTALHIVNAHTYLSSKVRAQAPALIKSRINQRDAKNKHFNDSQLTRHLVPPPNPRDTIGDYFDKYATILDGESNDTIISETPESELTGRGLVHGTGYLGSLWSGSKETYNISISRCIEFADIIGTWTSSDGTTTENATLENINSDLRTQFTTVADLSDHLKSRILNNTAQAVLEAQAFLNSTICNANGSKVPPLSPSPIVPSEEAALATEDPSYPDMTHDELRKLLYNNQVTHSLDTHFLAIDGYWTAVLMSMSAGAGVGGALYKGFYNRNASSENVAIVCFTAAGLIFARGIIERIYMTGTLRFIEASVISAFTSWFRQAVAVVSGLQNDLRQVGSDNHMSGCLEEIVIEDSVDSLPGYSQPQAGIIELIPMGGVCPG